MAIVKRMRVEKGRRSRKKRSKRERTEDWREESIVSDVIRRYQEVSDAPKVLQDTYNDDMYMRYLHETTLSSLHA